MQPASQLLPAIPNTYALVYDRDNDADGFQSFKVIAWAVDTAYVGRRVTLFPVGEHGPIDITKPHAIRVGNSILSNGFRFENVDEWLETYL